MSLFTDLRSQVVESSVDLSTVLRKARLLAVSLDAPDLDTWVQNELGGYPDADSLPPYRILHLPLMGTFSSPFKVVRNFPIPVSMLPENLKRVAERTPMGHSVRELETMAKASKDSLRHTWPTEGVILAQKHVEMIDGGNLIELYQPVPKASIEGVLDAVRNRLLDFLLALQRLNPAVASSEDAISTIPSDEVSQQVRLTIYGDHNVVAAGSHISQSVEIDNSTGDISGLKDVLGRLGLLEEDMAELETAIQQDETPQSKHLGPAVAGWIGKMVSKAVAGTWQVATGAASGVLTQAILRYYGLN